MHESKETIGLTEVREQCSQQQQQQRTDEFNFPGRLFAVLECAITNGCEHVISWVADGVAFAIHDQKLVATLMDVDPVCKSGSGVEKFSKLLKALGFSMLNPSVSKELSPHGLVFYHPFFQNDMRWLLRFIKHIPIETEDVDKNDDSSPPTKVMARDTETEDPPDVVSSMSTVSPYVLPAIGGYDSDESESSLVF